MFCLYINKYVYIAYTVLFIYIYKQIAYCSVHCFVNICIQIYIYIYIVHSFVYIYKQICIYLFIYMGYSSTIIDTIA